MATSQPTHSVYFREQMVELLPQAQRSFTYDQGSEFFDHETITAATGMVTYFCDPHVPWQRGAIENVNTRLRCNLARKVPLENDNSEDLEDALCLYHTTPRKCLGYRTALETFTDQLTPVAVAH